MAKVNANDLEKESLPSFIGHRKSVQISEETTRRTQKAAKGRESLSERSERNRTTTQRRHEINTTRKAALEKLLKETAAEQDAALLEEYGIANTTQTPKKYTKETAEHDAELRAEMEKIFKDPESGCKKKTPERVL